ncbi:lipid II:glycine glycyltransferase FemX [Jiangella alkaliphila]|uniref:Lipid II:glycine glycyltransferase (Peptidoglycan interpeptide bridge formation enzyme) n=1 Tax=Jiangella alkaliphila TaxID=419479 RepID=A0A1H2HMY4_9ACTN|nr:peptidoglycan bridge formation glycyltransferase FemA/FemB family protein [Jiangella alkaliphila]SDU33217.1 Lipid II:glycine glycyltransferase (Peptidoglycan interpeptide bridge formation enzyme) [Jiangella alkaliphila]
MTRSSTLTVREITSDQHVAAIAERPSVSFLQTPAWGVVKRDWRSRSVGWFDDDKLVGVALVLYRKAPRIRRSLAYIPEGPSIDWDSVAAAGDLQRWLAPLIEHVKAQGAFGLRLGPMVVTRRWHNATLKNALADPGIARLRDVPADETTATGTALAEQLTALGWRPPAATDGFAAGQPRHVFQLPLEGRDADDVLKGFNQLWRRNIKKADKSGVVVSLGTAADLPEFHRVYAETAQRDDFTPRPYAYFEGMWAAMTADAPERLRLYLAHHEGELVAAATMTRVGTHAWYSYGASTTTKRDVRGSNAIQWRMMQDALAEGCSVYDLRGITDTLSENDPHAGLIRFKLGTGGQAVEYLGEWDLPISRVLYSAFDLYMKRRS